MNTDERHRRIGELLRHREHVSVDELRASVDTYQRIARTLLAQ